MFNYVFSNGDAHLKNFSLIQSEFGDYLLSKAYDLMCTVLHTPNESDTALDLYKGDIESKFFSKYGFFGRPDFEMLAERIGLISKRAQLIIDTILGRQNEVLAMVHSSFLDNEAKEKYINYYMDKVRRF